MVCEAEAERKAEQHEEPAASRFIPVLNVPHDKIKRYRGEKRVERVNLDYPRLPPERHAGGEAEDGDEREIRVVCNAERDEVKKEHGARAREDGEEILAVRRSSEREHLKKMSEQRIKGITGGVRAAEESGASNEFGGIGEVHASLNRQDEKCERREKGKRRENPMGLRALSRLPRKGGDVFFP